MTPAERLAFGVKAAELSQSCFERFLDKWVPDIYQHLDAAEDFAVAVADFALLLMATEDAS